MRYTICFPAMLLFSPLVACTQLLTVQQSRDAMWQEYGGQPVDKILVTLGAPERETKLTDGSRMVMYQFNSVYESGSAYERQAVCQVTFMAKPPKFVIDNVAMKGDVYECNMLAQGHTGSVRHAGFESATPYMGAGPGMGAPPAYLYHYRY